MLATLLACSLLTPVFADKDYKREAPHERARVSVENFGQVNDHIYRGGQPTGNNYRQLAALGVKTIVDLRGDSERGVRAAAEAAGLRYINLPLAPNNIRKPMLPNVFWRLSATRSME